MTDQLQSARDQRTPPTGTPEQTDQDWTAASSSTQDSTAQDSTDADRPADDGAVYRGAGYDTAVDQPEVPVDHADPDHAVGVASVPGADPEVETIDRGAGDTAGVAAQDDVRTDAPDDTHGLYGHRADTPAAVEEVEAVGEPDGVPAMTDIGQPVDVDERTDVAGGETPIVPVPMNEAEPLDVTRADETLPGDLPEEPGLALFDSETTQQFRDRWHELQLRFVDDPHFAEGQAVALVDDVVTALRDAVDRQRVALHDWQADQGADAHNGDTERMRVAVRRYRDFLDHLLGV
jgi:hypothetical protein